MDDKRANKKIASVASRILRDHSASEIEKFLAGFALSGATRGHHPSDDAIEAAKKVIENKANYARECVELAEVVISRSK